MSHYYLGIDIGTYESKGVIVDSKGMVQAASSAGHALSMPRPGWAEHDAEELWWGDFVRLTRELLNKSGIDPAGIAGVGASSIAPCVLPVDRCGKPLRPAILYGIDTRATREIEELEKELGRETIFRKCGVVLSSQQTGPKIRWLRNHEPEVWEKTAHIMSGTSYITYRLTGRSTLDHYTAATFAPMYDPSSLSWSGDLCPAVLDPGMLPDLAWSSEIIGSVTAEAAAMTGLARGTPVVCGTADASAEALSGGVTKPGDFMMMYGSSLFFIAPVPAKVETQIFWPSSFLRAGSFAVAGGMSTSGSITRWFRDTLGAQELRAEECGGENAYAALSRLASCSVPGAGGLIALPYFYGERTPINDPDACGMFFGLSLRTTRADMYRALLESVAYGIRHNLDCLKEIAPLPGSLTAVGGGTKSGLWMQIISDVTGMEQRIRDNSLGACLGDAFLAALGTGAVSGLDDIHTWISPATTVKPASERKMLYDKAYRIYRELYSSTKHLMREARSGTEPRG